MNKKSIAGLIVFLAGILIDCFGICVMVLSMGSGAHIIEMWFGQLLNGWFSKLIGPVLLFMGIVIIFAGYFIACKCYCKKPKAKTSAETQSNAAPVINTPPVAPETHTNPVTPPLMMDDEKNTFVHQVPLAITTVTYIFCGNCGTRNVNDGSFCSGCGQKL